MRFFYSLIFIVFISCSNYDSAEDFEGNWIVLGIVHNGQKAYPETISDSIKIEFNVYDFEKAEKIKFDSSKKIAILPGFKSEKLIAKFKVDSGKLTLFSTNELSSEMKKTGDVFCNSYEIIKAQREGELILRSDKTTIALFNEKKAIDNRIDLILNN